MTKSSTLIPNNGKSVLLFSASWCGHCQDMKSEWKKFASSMAKSDVTVKEIDSSELKNSGVSISAYPTIMAFKNGVKVGEFGNEKRTSENFREFKEQAFNENSSSSSNSSNSSSSSSNTSGGSKRRRQSRQSRKQSTKQRRQSSMRMRKQKPRRRGTRRQPMHGGGPVDVQTSVPAHQQWTNPTTPAPPPAYNGGLYTGAPFAGPWGNIPVTPTTANYINNNLKSADPPPLATTQYPGTERLGNNFSAMPGVNWYEYGDNGPYNLQCVGAGTNADTVSSALSQTAQQQQQQFGGGGEQQQQASYVRSLMHNAQKIQNNKNVMVGGG